MPESEPVMLPSLTLIGIVRSSLTDRKECPRQGWRGAPDAWIEINPAFVDGLGGMTPGKEVIVLTWLHLADRDVLKVSPRDVSDDTFRGVFSTRSPDRPNPIGLHRVTILEIESGYRIRVGPLEALDGTPVIDIKPTLKSSLDA